MKKINVLVLGAGGNVSQGIIKALLMSKLDLKIIGACINENSLGLYMCDTSYLCPLANDDKFIPWLIEVCNNEDIQIVFTGVEENILSISANYDRIKLNTKAKCIFTSYDKLMIGQDKFATCEWLKENGCNYPMYCKSNDSQSLHELIQKAGFPLIAKPRKGKGSQGIVKINNQEDLIKVKELSDYVIQECIGDDNSEYTVGCYCNKHGKLVDVIIMHRELKYGTTFKATIIENEQIYKECVKICNKFKPIGPLNIQLRLDNEGNPVCFELNVRFSGTTPIRAHFGYNDVEAMIKEYILDEDIQDVFNIKKGIAYRYFDEMYIDECMQHTLKEEKVINDVSLYTNSAKGYRRGE